MNVELRAGDEVQIICAEGRPRTMKVLFTRIRNDGVPIFHARDEDGKLWVWTEEPPELAQCRIAAKNGAPVNP